MYVCARVWVFLLRTNEKHRALLTTCERAIVPGGCSLIFYTYHRPHVAQRDMGFFDIARERGWECEKVLAERFPVRFSVVLESFACSFVHPSILNFFFLFAI